MMKLCPTCDLPNHRCDCPTVKDQASVPSDAASCSLSERLDQLVEQWERRTIAADKLTNDSAGAGDWTTNIRCKAKAGTIRSMTVELKRVMREANSVIE